MLCCGRCPDGPWWLQTDPEKIKSLVVLPQFLQRATFENKRNKGHFETLLRLLKDIYLKSTDQETLSNAASSLRHLLQHDTTEEHKVAAAIEGMVRELLSRLGSSKAAAAGVSQAAKDDDEDVEDEDLRSPGSCGSRRSSRQVAKASKRAKDMSGPSTARDAEFATGLVLLQLASLARQIDLQQYNSGKTDIWARVQEAVVEVLDVSTWPAGEDRLKSVARIVTGGTQTLYLLLLHSMQSLERAVEKELPSKSDAADDHMDEEASTPEQLEKEAEKVQEQRLELVEVLSQLLALGHDDDHETSPEETGQSQGSHRLRSRPRLVRETIAELQRVAYSLVSELRMLFRAGLSKFSVRRRWLASSL
jgi:hypothetical protein